MRNDLTENGTMKTRNIKPQLIDRIKGLATLSELERGYAISDIVDSLLSRTVTVRQRVPDPIGSPVPAYDPDTDGDYSEFLVVNNCD